LELRKHAVADEQLARRLDPVFAERRLRAVHRGPAKAERHISIVIHVLRVPEPRVLHAVPADERDAAVDDAELAMVSLVLMTDLLEAAVVEAADPAAGGLEPGLRLVAHALAAECVDQQAH